jgi:hypothetical protein
MNSILTATCKKKKSCEGRFLECKYLLTHLVMVKIVGYVEFRATWVLYKSFNHTLRYIGDVISINNHYVHNYVHLIYSDELEIKDTTEYDKSASYLNILLNIDSNARLITSLCTNVMIFTLQSSTFLF